MYNKNTYLKTNDKKILHKSGKQWVTVSIAMLALLGGGAVASRTTTHAATTQGANTSATVQVKNRMNDALANNNQAQQPSNNKPTTQNITNEASTLHSALIKQGVDQGSDLKKFSPESVERSKPTSAESSATSSSADSKSVASGSNSTSASSNNDATNTYVIPKNNRGWDYVQDGVKDQVPNSGSSSSATSGSASNNSASVPKHNLGSTPTYSSKGITGTFVSTRNARKISYTDIYGASDGLANNVPSLEDVPNKIDLGTSWSFVDAQGNISASPVTNSQGNIMVAPTYAGLTYKYDKANNSVEFVDGTLNWTNSYSPFTSGYAPSIIQKAKSMQFDNNVNTNNANKNELFTNDPNLQSLTLSYNFDTRDINTLFMFYNDSNLNTITIQSPNTIFTKSYRDFNDLIATQSTNPNGKTHVVNLADGQQHIGTWTLAKQHYDGMAYKYNKANNSVEFIGGPMKGGYQFIPEAPSNIKNANSIKFDSDVDTSQISDSMAQMFQNATNLQSLSLPDNFDTSNVSDMSAMFDGDTNLQSLTLPESFNTHKVSDMGSMFQSDKNLQSLILPPSFNTSSVSDMGNMFMSNDNLQSLSLPDSFDTTGVSDMFGMFEFDDKLRAIDINSSNTRFNKDAIIDPHTNVVDQHLGNWLGAQPSDRPTLLMNDGPHVGLYLNSYDPKVTDTINFMNNNNKVGTLTFTDREYSLPHEITASDISKVPSGYKLADPNNSIFQINNKIPFNGNNVYNVPVKSAPVTKDTDYIHFEDANSKAVVEPTLQVTGNNGSNYNVQANQIPKNYKLATTNNGNGFVMNNGDHVVYVTRTNTDNGDPNIPISSNTVTFNGTIDLHFHNGNNTIQDITLPYSIATANNQTIKYLLNGTNPHATIPTDYLNKVINQFNTANFTYDNNTDSKEYDNVVVDPNVSSYKTGTNGDTINNGTITLNFSPTDVNEKVNYSYNGKNEGSNTFTGLNDTKGSTKDKSTGQGIKQGYHIAPTNPDNTWTYGNEGAHNDTDTVNVVPNNINGTATVTLVYKESDGTVDDTETKQIPIHNQVGGKQIVDPWDYARDNYTQPNSDWIITFPSDANETNYNLTKTFTYVAQTAPELEIRYVDVDPNATPTKGESTDKQGRPIISTNTYSGSQLQKKNGNIKWIVGNTVTIDDTNSSNPNNLHLIQAPKGFHLDEHQQGFDYQNGSEKITLEPNATDSTGHPMILMSIGMFNPFSNHKKPTNPVKPASSASAKPSSASVAPSSKASSASSSVAPSSRASTTPSSSSVAPSSESASVAPSSANNTVIYYNPTSVTNNSIESAPSEASVASVSATPKSASASTTTTKVSAKKARPNRSAKLVPINHKIHKNIKKTNKVVANKPSKIARYKVVVKNGKPALKTANITNRVASDNAPVKHAVVESTTTKSVPDNQSFMMKVPNSNQKVQVQVNNANKLPQTGEATNNTLIASIIMLLASVVLAGVSIDRKHDND